MAEGNGAAPIPAPLAAPPRVGLMQAVVRPDAPDGWLNGIQFDPEDITPTFDPSSDYWWDSCIPGATDPTVVDEDAAKTTGTRPSRVVFRPWAVVEGDTCTGRWAEPARALRKLAAATPAKVEREFWTGVLVTAGGFENQFLASEDAVLLSEDAIPLQYALADLQQYAAETMTNRALIHCTVDTASLWLSAGMIRREGQVWMDLKDNIIVPGDGYPGTGPPDSPARAARQHYAYVTGPVYYLEESTPTVVPGNPAEAHDPTNNTTTYRAERSVLPWWDTICHGAILVDTCNTCCDSTEP